MTFQRKGNELRQRITVRLDQAIRDELDDLATRTNCTRTEVVEQALEAYFADKKKDAQSKERLSSNRFNPKNRELSRLTTSNPLSKIP